MHGNTRNFAKLRPISYKISTFAKLKKLERKTRYSKYIVNEALCMNRTNCFTYSTVIVYLRRFGENSCFFFVIFL